MHDPNTRRGFLRGLASLPLIGGGVTLIGNPTRAAEPVTPGLLEAYDSWLFYERRFLRFERFGPIASRADKDDCHDPRFAFVDLSTGKAFDYVTLANAGGRYHGIGRGQPQPSTRAAVVLSAVGCNWREGD